MSRIKILLLGLIMLALVGAATGVGLAQTYLQPVNPNNTTKERFVIPRGQSVQVIGERLYEAGLVRNPWVFRFVVKQQGLQGKLQAGSFDISPAMTPAQIAHALTAGTQDVWIKVLEGWRAEEIAESLESYELPLYSKEEFIALAQGKEGKLFPDTYLIPKESSTEQIVNLLTSTFDRKVTEGLAAEIARSEKSFDEILIMASLIEREARDYEQMRHVSGILWNRINIGMPLQVDATLQYSNGYNSTLKTWWAVPTRADKQIDSVFNTYTNSGLPPAPICNPSLNAVRAALDPLQVDDLYYIHAPSGEMYYAKTLDGHNANVHRYLR